LTCFFSSARTGGGFLDERRDLEFPLRFAESAAERFAHLAAFACLLDPFGEATDLRFEFGAVAECDTRPDLFVGELLGRRDESLTPGRARPVEHVAQADLRRVVGVERYVAEFLGPLRHHGRLRFVDDRSRPGQHALVELRFERQDALLRRARPLQAVGIELPLLFVPARVLRDPGDKLLLFNALNASRFLSRRCGFRPCAGFGLFLFLGERAAAFLFRGRLLLLLRLARLPLLECLLAVLLRRFYSRDTKIVEVPSGTTYDVPCPRLGLGLPNFHRHAFFVLAVRVNSYPSISAARIGVEFTHLALGKGERDELTDLHPAHEPDGERRHADDGALGPAQ
jgi:hypothetical protein